MIKGFILSLLIVLMIIPCSSSNAEDPHRRDWDSLLHSGREGDLDVFMTIFYSNRQMMIDYLLEEVRKPISRDDQFLWLWTPRNTAIRMLGEFRAEEAVPDLVGWLESKPEIGHMSETNPPPAMTALIQIGLPSVGPLLDKIKEIGVSKGNNIDFVDENGQIHMKKDSYETAHGDLCLDTIVKIKGMDETLMLFDREVNATTDERVKERLRDAINVLTWEKEDGKTPDSEKMDEAKRRQAELESQK